MNPYALISEVYDRWQETNDSSRWADYAEKIIKRHCRLSKGDGKDDSLLLLDLGCGTGSLPIEMSNRGYEVLAIDYSEEMLSAAKTKAGAQNIQFICQDITDFELFGTVDIMVCFLDTVNHILTERKLNSFFRLCKNYLNPGGLLIFDIATPYYFENNLADKTFYDIRDTFALIWQNFYNPLKSINRAELTFFTETSDGNYLRGEETIKERSYRTDFIESLIKGNGLEILREYRDFTFKKPTPETERIFFVVENRNDRFKEKLIKDAYE